MNNIVSDVADNSLAITKWQRLSPLSVIFFIGKLLTKIVKDMLPGLAPLGVLVFSSDNKSLILILFAIAVSSLILLSSFLQYWFFKYKQEGDKVLINDGVFNKNKRVISFERIQNINILQPIYFKYFGLVTLQIQTAGAKGNEADLAGIPESLANSLRNTILEKKSQILNNQSKDSQLKGGSIDASANDSLQQETNLLASASLIDLMKYGISSNGMFWFFVILTPILGMLDDILEKVFTKEDMQGVIELLGGGLSGKIISVFLFIFSIIILMFIFSIIGAVFRYYRYQLIQTVSQSKNTQDCLVVDKTLKRTSGLLTSYEESLKLNKIQSFIARTNIIGKWLSVEHITLGQVSSGQKNQPQKQSLFIIPARKIEQTQSLLKHVFNDAPDEIETQGISKRYIHKTIILKLFLPSLIICLPITFINQNYWLGLIPIIVPAIFFPLVYRRWKAYRYGIKDGYARFERGLFGYRHITFPTYKVQRVEVRQSPIQRRRNLSTLKVYLASNQLKMQFIPFDEANKWLEEINKAIHNDKRDWY
ncbi:MAG: putative membrane protein [Polaribacter sp.]|jgi:putative membrane protein